MNAEMEVEHGEKPPPTAEAPSSGPVPPGEPRPKARRGFAAMDPKAVRAIAHKGGKAAHAAGTAHEFTSEEARAAGRKGGRASHARRRALEQTDDGPEADVPREDKGGR
jgi:general stress protein YciG